MVDLQRSPVSDQPLADRWRPSRPHPRIRRHERQTLNEQRRGIADHRAVNLPAEGATAIGTPDTPFASRSFAL